MENTKMEVKINGMEYTIVSNEPEEYVQRVALMVNKKIAEVKTGGKGLSTAMLAVMAAMNLADELIKSEAAAENLRKEISVYMDEVQAGNAELEMKKLEVENLKEEMHKLEIELAKRDTELENLRMMRSQMRQSETAQVKAAQTKAAPVRVQPQETRSGAERPVRYNGTVIGRGVPSSDKK